MVFSQYRKFSKRNRSILRTFHLSKVFMARRGRSRLSLETSLSHTTEKSPSVTLLFEKLSGLKKLHKMVYHDFVENWFSHSTVKYRRGLLQFSEKILLSKNFLDRTEIWRLSLETFLSHSNGKLRRGTLVFHKNSGLKKLHKMVYHHFVENWFSHSTEKIRRGTLRF